MTAATSVTSVTSASADDAAPPATNRDGALDVLLVEPYYGGSHRDWADGYVAHSRHRVRLVTHEAAFWRWRMRGAALTLAELIEADVEAHGRPDVVVVSDLVDLPTLRWFARDSFGQAPVVLYLHENQLTHPIGPRQVADEGLQARNWMSMAAADLVLINTESHRRDLTRALQIFLKRPANRRHLHLLDEVLERCEILPVGVSLTEIETRRDPVDPVNGPTVLWNQRWDAEKNPVAVFRALGKLADEGLAFRIALAGEDLRFDTAELDQLEGLVAERIVHKGFIPDRSGYVELLATADIVVGAADHETFGIAVVEAMVAGAVPVLPDRLSYPELIPPPLRDRCIYPDGHLRRRLGDVITNLDSYRSDTTDLADDLRRYGWTTVAPRYDTRLEQLVADQPC